MEKIQRKTKIEKSIRFAKVNPDLFEGEAFDGRIDIKDWRISELPLHEDKQPWGAEAETYGIKASQEDGEFHAGSIQDIGKLRIFSFQKSLNV